MQAELSLQHDLRSQRFDLRPLTTDSAPLFAELAADTEIVKTLIGDWSTARKRLQNARAWIESASNHVIWGISDRNGDVGEAGGFIGIYGVETALPGVGKGPSIYYAFSQAVWGKGVGSEVTASVIDHLFENTNINAIEALVFPRINPASARLLEKQGMRLVGRYPVAEYIGDDCLPTLDYEVWRAQVALPADARACTAEAAFKIGQLVGDGISNHDDMAAALLISAHENGLVEAIGIDASKQVIADALRAGITETGWLHYRLQRAEHFPRG